MISTLSFASNQAEMSVSFGPVIIGENRLSIEDQDFKIKVKVEDLKIKTKFIKNSVEWIRVNDSLLIPRARIAVWVPADSKRVYLKYLGKSLLFQSVKDRSYTQIYVSLFHPGDIEVHLDGKLAGTISFEATKAESNDKRHLIDYSCARYMLEVTGLDGEYLSVGCRLNRRGDFGDEKPMLEVSWVTPNFILPDGSSPPFITTLVGNYPVKTTLKDKHGVERVVEVKAKIPKNLNRLKTAMGLGPYLFKTQKDDEVIKSDIAAALMIYGNFYIRHLTSIRFFDAVVWEKSLFNNFGTYFAYELGTALDQRFQLTALLGVQALSFRHGENRDIYTRGIYPQGFELVYTHAFGIKNCSLVYGMFLSTSGSEPYKNLWIRMGRSIFWELNYIDWSYEGRRASMWGLSIGFPFLSFL